MPAGCKDLLAKLLTVKPKDRITLADIMVHPWITDTEGPLVPFSRPVADADSESLHLRVVQALQKHDITSSQIENAISMTACNAVYATYKFTEMKIKKFNVKRRVLPRTQSDNVLPRRAEVEDVTDRFRRVSPGLWPLGSL
jgi:serine/threonine protein kinase